ncbi:hypothetical protein CSB45_13895 [candidate division KSB3 bacterium]|uniref:Low-complexity protein n=1 Tax=candidate division KSB3 bacterium TaxID=2044937 RepID=A0A2G6E1S3_9BACT|nr:MAG: hypothetical protein CSB45_13895 [candidate division KSB3 bacterium]PIE28500.1 MAG: hypothetical protein CSA57_13420 [candidate division KSB3 bacterium]
MAEKAYSRQEISDFIYDGQSFERADLRGADLFKMDLSGQNFQDADLSEADLRGAILEGVNLRGASLRCANLRQTNLRQADLTDAQLERASLQRADLTDACLKNAVLRYAIMKNVNISDTDFSGADLRDANLNGAIGALTANFHDARMEDAHVRYTELDVLEMASSNVKGGSKHPDRGWRAYVFKNVKTSWVEFAREWLDWMVIPFRIVKKLLVGLFRVITVPLRFFRS